MIFDDAEQTREDDITMIYQTQAALAMLAELLARDRSARLSDRAASHMAILEFEITAKTPSLRRH